jgi:phenylalanyl-tRNA synthetase alpha chain
MDPPEAGAREAEEAMGTLDVELERGLGLVRDAATLESLEEAETAVLGRRSPFAAVQRGLRELPEAARRDVGRRTNEVREALQDAVAARRDALERRRQEDLLQQDRVDLTLPGRRPRRGGLHPMSVVERQLVAAFVGMGYRVAEGPEIEDDWHNFQALNIPPDHPARTMKDTLYVQGADFVFRTETSAVQVRTMEAQQPPVYVVAPGRVFRRDVVDATHYPVFAQIEGLAVDEGLSFAHLKGTLEEFARAAFGPTHRVRLIPSFFPFTEPSAELDVSCFACDGVGCRICGTGWIEIGGCGMVDPAVFEAVGYDPERYTGFAFGMGIERVALVRYAIPDIRLLYQGDQRFLRQFRGVVA